MLFWHKFRNQPSIRTKDGLHHPGARSGTFTVGSPGVSSLRTWPSCDNISWWCSILVTVKCDNWVNNVMCLYTDHQVGCLPHSYLAVQERHCDYAAVLQWAVPVPCSNYKKEIIIFFILLTTILDASCQRGNSNVCLYYKIFLSVKLLEALALWFLRHWPWDLTFTDVLEPYSISLVCSCARNLSVPLSVRTKELHYTTRKWIHKI